MKGFRKILWSLSAIVAVLFAGCFTACVEVLDFTSSSSNSEENEAPVKITATYEQSGQVFTDTPLDDLRADLTVSVETTLETVTETDDYTLSGTLAVGESEITVTYNSMPTLTATFSVSVSEKNVHTHVFTNYVSDNNATCTQDGTKTAVCDREDCQETDTIVDVDTKLGHSYTNYVSNNDATCTQDGTKTAVCDREDCQETDTIVDVDTKLGHSYTNYVSNNDATCTQDGTKTATCDRENCEETDTVEDEDSTVDHAFENYVSNNDATCTQDGTKTGDCKYGCGTKDTVTDEGTKLAHVFTNYVSDDNATCEADGTKTAVCDRDNCEGTDTVTDEGTKLAHVFTNYVSDGNATCEADGTKTAVCDRDNCEGTDTVTDEGTKLAHVFTNYVSDNNATCTADGTKTAVCDRDNCEETDTQPDVGSAREHIYTHYVSNNDATCTENGTETASCDNGCGQTDTRTEENSALGHSYTNYVSNNDATCTEDGTETASCDNGCGQTDTRTEENSALGHSYTASVTAPTCTEKGYTTYTCGCGDSYVDDYVDALGHAFTNYVSNNDAELGKDGTKTATCDRDNCEETDTVTDVGSALEHSYTNYVSDNNATCTQDGTKTATCDNGCGTTNTIPDEGSKKGHLFTNYESDNNATCTEDGTETASCDNGCGTKDTRTEENSARGHSYTEVVTAPTCTAQGYTTHTCVCGDSHVDTYVNALGHSYTNYESDNNATCTENGTETASCDNGCGTKDTRTEENSARGHSYTASVTAPTCTGQGYTTHTCACGDSYVDTYVNALGHSHTNYVSDNNATCQKDGTKTAVCDRDNCKETDTVTDEGTKLSHVFTNYVSDNNATCTEDGTKTAVCDRKNCEETKTQPDVGSKKGHVFTNYESNEDATCEEDGTETASCDNGCGTKDTRTEENSAFGHSYTHYVSDNNATCEEDGTETASCNNGCGQTDTRTEENSAFGHTFKQSKCERCTATNNLSIVTVPSVTRMYYGEQPTFTDGAVKDELGETVTSGTWSITGVSYLASGSAKEITANAFVTFTPNGTEYASVSNEIQVTLLAVAQYGNNYYATVDGALETANKSNSGTVYVLPLESELDSGRAKIAKTIAVVSEIKSGVTFTLPYAEDALDTLVSYVIINNQTYRSSAYGNTTYLKNQIYIAEEHTLNNAGQINVAGELCGGTEVNYSPAYPQYANSVTAGRHAQINLGANAKLITTGTVNCYGFINEETADNGSEFIVEKGKATVVFTIVEYRGERIYLGMIDPSDPEVKSEITSAGIQGALGTGKYTPHTFQSSPFNRFFIESVTAKTTVKYGAQLLGHAVLRAYKQDQQTTLNLINNSNAILALTQRGGSVIYKYDPSTRKTDLDVYGDATLNPLKLQLTITVSGVSVELTLTTGAVEDSDGIFFPISDYWDISLNAVNGSSTVNALAQKVKLLPGAKLTIGKGVVVNASEIAVYANNELLINGREDKHYKTNVPAELIVYGTLNVQAIGGRVIAGADGACLNIEKGTSVISKEIAERQTSVDLEIAGQKIPYFPIVYSSDENSTLMAVGDNGDALSVNAYTAKNGKWEIGVKVSLKLNDGTDSATSQSFPCGYALNASDLLIPKRANHEFKGWYTTENCASGTEFASTTLNDEITLYAKWEKLPKLYDVTFQAVGTNANDVANTETFASQEITADSLFAFEPADQAGTFEDDTACGRYVVGYYADQDGTVEFDFSQEITQNTTVYVKWADKIKVTIGTGTSSVTAGGKTMTKDEFYVMSGTEIVVTASKRAGLGKTTVTITESYEKNSATGEASLFGTATATLTFTATLDTTVTVTKS